MPNTSITKEDAYLIMADDLAKDKAHLATILFKIAQCEARMQAYLMVADELKHEVRRKESQIAGVHADRLKSAPLMARIQALGRRFGL